MENLDHISVNSNQFEYWEWDKQSQHVNSIVESFPSCLARVDWQCPKLALYWSE